MFLAEYAVDLLYAFANCSGLDLIFGLNALLRTSENTWNSTNAELLLKYCESRQYVMSWELGNGRIWDLSFEFVYAYAHVPVLNSLIIFI